MKITDKSLNLDVQGQSCWNDCYHPGSWSQKVSSGTSGCVYSGSYYNAEGFTIGGINFGIFN